MKKLLLLFLLPQVVFAATITGVVYDLEFEPVTSVVTVDTQPEQRAVAKEGAYTFTVPEGSYHLVAVAEIEGERWLAEENITVAGEGEYTLDLILIPDFSDIDALGLDHEFLDLNGERDVPWLLFIVIGIVAIVGLTLFYTKMLDAEPPEKIVLEDEFRKAVLKILKKHKGRISQRDLRKEVPFSEAKVSLVLTELENEGKIKKIKKGRGNVIILQ